VTSNGARKPPRPRIELVAGNPTEEEGAAVLAALERFLAETAPAPEAPRASRWQQAGLTEGVNRDPGAASWGTQRGGTWR
jgi:Acyl-CoA carboxylase epsilon subunit